MLYRPALQQARSKQHLLVRRDGLNYLLIAPIPVLKAFVIYRVDDDGISHGLGEELLVLQIGEGVVVALLENDLNLAASREVAGDRYDCIPLAGDRYLLCVGDVSGKGMPAALLMSTCLSLLRAYAEVLDSPSAIMRRLNRRLCPNNPTCAFTTLVLAVLDGRSGELRYCNAGHNPSLLKRRDGPVESLGQVHGPALGVKAQISYGEPQHDDITVLIAQRHRHADHHGRADMVQPESHSLQLTLHGADAGLRQLRTAVANYCQSEGIQQRLQRRLKVIVDELVSNLLLHAHAQGGRELLIEVKLDRTTEGLLLCVRDNGQPFNPLEAPAPDVASDLEDRAIGGLGLHLVRQLANSFTYRREGSCNVVTLELG